MNRNLLAVCATVIAVALLGALSYESYLHRPHPCPADNSTTVRPLPDPDDCVQLGWLDGAWRCITEEEAG